MDKNPEFQQFLVDDWEYRLRADPLFATSTGDNRYNDRLPDISEAYFQEYLQALRGFESRQAGIDLGSLSPAEKLDYEIYRRLLQNEMDMLVFKAYRMPISRAGGFHIYFPEMYRQMPMVTEKDIENYISRLSAFRQYVEGHIEIMRRGLQEGQIPPKVTMAGVLESIQPHLAGEPNESVFFQPMKELPPSLPKEKVEHLQKASREAILRSVVPGYRLLNDFLEKEYLPACRENIAASELPGGREYYRLCIRHFTSLELSPQEIHQVGLDQVAAIQAEMLAVFQQLGYGGDLDGLVQFMRTDGRFYAATPGELLEKTSLVLKRMDGELPGLFKTLPRLPYGIREIPLYAAPGNTTAYYQPGAGDGSRAGTYYVNTYDLKSRPFYEIEALSLHEAVPGHHLQLALQQELDLSPFRRFNGFTSFVEGWALYAERLGLEVGFYTDPYSNFGRLSYAMWRACRLVVDTGIHALGWTRQKAIDFMAAYTSLTLLNITNEVDRYIAWPGQALAYKLGEIKIRQLRQRAEEALGQKFDRREFHEVILRNGAVPLDVLEKLVEAWLQPRP